ncbi:MAG TPA: 4-hydroxythreonine-4-phosphate dehydrogenase PdxA [Candidatus Desulfofervidus auxilii]|uniref:4-hydroxythreonine-4-phosphate dehydrogenase n=1 Tax=Desulfofervidus auxilii TaxID=1621989 RepID=A0A7C0YAJ4_DESA2|nr:4-hydroxythreonine-4-phosphate dehydrogenase PdxA [Candidatus Desulfofervidus auxilii]
MLPYLAITLGDVCGIGPEITLKVLSKKEVYQFCYPIVIGDATALKKAAKLLKIDIKLMSPWEKGFLPSPNHIFLLEVSHLSEKDLIYGKPTVNSARASVDYIKIAVDLALKKKVNGIVTCPVNKAAINRAGISFSGHTELLAKLTNTKHYAMLFLGKKLKVALLTIHVPLKKVPTLVTQEKLFNLIALTFHFLKEKLNISNPRIAVAGLNPHAGEEGLMGDEEIKIISPAIKKAKENGIDVKGPFPPDTVFYLANEGKFDVVISMYHDQGLIPFKLLHFRDGVNVTMGLPIVRTSVDHGTAYDIAGKGIADERSLFSALHLAAKMAFKF